MGHQGNHKIVKYLLNVFSEGKKEQLIEYLMQGDKDKDTALHLAADNGNQKIVELLLNVFSKQDQEKFIDFLMKENESTHTALFIASKNKHETIVKLFCQKLTDSTEPIIV